MTKVGLVLAISASALVGICSIDRANAVDSPVYIPAEKTSQYTVLSLDQASTYIKLLQTLASSRLDLVKPWNEYYIEERLNDIIKYGCVNQYREYPCTARKRVEDTREAATLTKQLEAARKDLESKREWLATMLPEFLLNYKASTKRLTCVDYSSCKINKEGSSSVRVFCFKGTHGTAEDCGTSTINIEFKIRLPSKQSESPSLEDLNIRYHTAG